MADERNNTSGCSLYREELITFKAIFAINFEKEILETEKKYEMHFDMMERRERVSGKELLAVTLLFIEI